MIQNDDNAVQCLFFFCGDPKNGKVEHADSYLIEKYLM